MTHTPPHYYQKKQIGIKVCFLYDVQTPKKNCCFGMFDFCGSEWNKCGLFHKAFSYLNTDNKGVLANF